ncbi:hypothetical protein HCN08_13845 [Streptomyces sp. PRB2-1]|uniref:Uncharacterized protein n=2 Tax=Actinacidiphila epipremni TaxID=2053013 RepID=A0ABX0ZL16_9ACTN|nr:hypothetical protein [Actinacidiphila epipremni]
MPYRHGRWLLIVVLLGVPLSQCSELQWPEGTPTPTPAQRREALAALGYRAAPGAEWQWAEMSADPDAVDAGPVELFAALDVQPIGGE